MAQEMTAWTKYQTGMRFEVESGSGHSMIMDASTEDGGQNTGPRPLELLLMGLAGCAGMDIISVLKKKRQQVTAYEVVVKGTRATKHPMVFVEITVEHIVTGHGVQAEAVERAIQLAETKYCGAGVMLGKTAKLTHTYRIIDLEKLPAPASKAGKLEKIYPL